MQNYRLRPVKYPIAFQIVQNLYWQLPNMQKPIQKIKVALSVMYIHTTRSYNLRVRPLTQYDSTPFRHTVHCTSCTHTRTLHTAPERDLKDRSHQQTHSACGSISRWSITATIFSHTVIYHAVKNTKVARYRMGRNSTYFSKSSTVNFI